MSPKGKYWISVCEDCGHPMIHSKRPPDKYVGTCPGCSYLEQTVPPERTYALLLATPLRFDPEPVAYSKKLTILPTITKNYKEMPVALILEDGRTWLRPVAGLPFPFTVELAWHGQHSEQN